LLEFPLVRKLIEHANGGTAAGRSIRYHLLTNGLLLTSTHLAYLADHAVRLTLSCDGVAPAQDLRHPGSSDRIDALLDELRAEYPRYLREHVGVSLTLVPSVVRHLSASVAHLELEGLRDITINPVIAPGTWTRTHIRELNRQLGQVCARAQEQLGRTGLIAVTNLRRAGSAVYPPRHRPWGCGAPEGRALAVDVDGRVYPCVLAARSYQQFPRKLDARMRGLSLGDIRAPDFPARLSSLAAASRRSGLFEPQSIQRSGERSCATCRFRADCFVCPIARVHGPSSDINDVPEYLCAFNRTVAKYRRRLSAELTPQQRMRALVGRLQPHRLLDHRSRARGGFGADS
jgi:sulfatase maturation enzyme AslB (radical SAM superfamily)